jgi:hypothetical protein
MPAKPDSKADQQFGINVELVMPGLVPGMTEIESNSSAPS